MANHWITRGALMLVLATTTVMAQTQTEPAGEATLPPSNPDTAPAPTAPPAEPAPLSPTVERGLAWLVEQQQADGGWGQGEESTRMGRHQEAGQNARDLSNVADTCVAALALLRAGSTPTQGPHSTAINEAVAFVCGQIEAADDESLWITDIRGTRVQSKIGPYIDTFVAALLLAEVKDHMPDAASEQRVVAALDKTMDKIQRHQQEDGRWEGRGWAGGLSNAMAVKAVNRATQVGVQVDETVRERAQQSAQARSQVDANGNFADDGRSAGIELYAGAAAVGELQDAVATNRPQRENLRAGQARTRDRLASLEEQIAAAEGEPAEQLLAEAEALRGEAEKMQRRLDNFNEADADFADARQALGERLADDDFIAGFGSNGGEEFLSYLSIGEALVADGGEPWQAFEQRMANSLGTVQNDDGSWTGHHCITGRTFCTSVALMVLTVDRSPAAVAARLQSDQVSPLEQGM